MGVMARGFLGTRRCPPAPEFGRATIESGTADGTISADWTPVGSGSGVYGGIVFRYTGPQGFLYVYIWNDTLGLGIQSPATGEVTLERCRSVSLVLHCPSFGGVGGGRVESGRGCCATDRAGNGVDYGLECWLCHDHGRAVAWPSYDRSGRGNYGYGAARR